MDSEKVSVATLIERANTELFERMYSEAEDAVRERSLEVGRAPNFRTAPTGPLA